MRSNNNGASAVSPQSVLHASDDCGGNCRWFEDFGDLTPESRLLDWMENFTAIRNGILDHIRDGKICPFDLGIYVFLHLRADWSSGIFHACAATIAYQFGDGKLKKPIQRSLRRLRDRKYINYREGSGQRGGYPILIHKYGVTVGGLLGTRLNAWTHGDLVKTEYEPEGGSRAVGRQSCGSGGAVEGPIQDLKTLQDVKDVKTKAKPRAEAPSLEEVSAYCRERRNHVNPQLWMDHYTANGWKVGRNPMKDWKAAVRTWEKNGVNNANGNTNRAEQRQQSNIDAARRATDIVQRRMANSPIPGPR